MLEKYPHIKDLYGYDLVSPCKVFLSFFLQMVTCYFIQNQSWMVILPLSYLWGGTINHSLMLAIHELSHDLFFPQVWQNAWFGIFASLPIGLPISGGFKKFHLIHHRSLGIDTVDPDLPTILEAKYVQHPIAKFFFLFLQPFFYVGRPLLTQSSSMQFMEIVGLIAQIIFNGIILHFFGWKSMCYLILGSLLGAGIHPLAGHFVGEHYMWGKYETYSYYGPLNYLVYNVGWHNEHHDFPRIPGSRLPQLHKIAPEFYKDIGVLESWPMVFVRFIFDPTITPFSRLKRKQT